ncbi:restriction endonuclease subunit S [Paenibacillus spongiae]|uniref:Restriction endonuclease subunit S n=1 Tax=Paenibacillus spongiae TaxID=2909671 RepID=A0ABY5S4Y4_9BACL|nr:restriction endonuclease subunit S [Paenibacillus spongiae]UVI28655.1 restriction endonuclease subunit S [Paenibacillus spongiae]
MSRETAYARMLDASAKLQQNVAMILEAKATEAEKVRNWLCNHVTPDAYQEQQAHLKDTLGVHEQLIEVIDGLAKLNQGMANVLKAVLRHDQEDSSSGFGNMDFGEPTQ